MIQISYLGLALLLIISAVGGALTLTITLGGWTRDIATAAKDISDLYQLLIRERENLFKNPESKEE